jgi:fumarate reductase flavoprotein subunit
LDVMRMELPPGWRGYGAKERIEHPYTAQRQAEVEAARNQGKSRYELQRELMPFEHLLPESLRGRNARFQEDSV